MKNAKPKDVVDITFKEEQMLSLGRLNGAEVVDVFPAHDKEWGRVWFSGKLITLMKDRVSGIELATSPSLEAKEKTMDMFNHDLHGLDIKRAEIELLCDIRDGIRKATEKLEKIYMEIPS